MNLSLIQVYVLRFLKEHQLNQYTDGILASDLAGKIREVIAEEISFEEVYKALQDLKVREYINRKGLLSDMPYVERWHVRITVEGEDALEIFEKIN